MKRLFDFIFALILLIVLSPLMLIIAVLIKLESKGPVFFRQKRIGKGNRIFLIYKFRTMVTGTPDVATDKLTNPEVYVTRIGKVLRKTSLDEVPQLINIIKGEMSFVGPRPALYNQYELIEMRNKSGVNDILPGLTGLAQINGRDLISEQEKIKYDMAYLQKKSFFYDLKILMQTAAQVTRGKDISG